MSTSDSIPPTNHCSAPTFLMTTLKATLAALCLALFASPAAADSIPIELTSGGTDRPFPFFAILTAAGEQFSMAVGLEAVSGIYGPGAPYAPGTTIVVHAAN